MGILRREALEETVLIGGLIGVQFLYAGNSVVLSYLMFLGFQPSSLIILSTFATFVVLAPLSFILERHQWPKRLCMKLWIQLLLISFGGVTLFQSLLMKGIRLTSPAIATAMPNLAPGLIFFIAWAFRLEKVELSCKYSKAKIVGTLFCVIGAILMSVLQDSSHNHSSKQIHVPLQPLQTLQAPPSYHDNGTFDFDKIIGSFYLVIAVFTLSSVIVLQAATLGDFPSPISISAITSLMGTVLTVIVELIQNHRLEIGFSKISVHALVAYSLLAGCISGASTSFNAWAMKKRGPVMVAVFGPVGTVISIMLSVIILGDSVTTGSLAGMFTMFTGLYFVLWAKGNEEFDYQSEYDLEKPLLS
ncbi:PREDICTED: WAT1-related protein At5g47470-like [Ipomoea nil]|uniref:WAT1-related protein At5g47470-like n=1 Tax=Ipomoea nil TaxID=35883 RepID=UPI000901E04C|nr:PREDICTED: WAT1-related protein At5g47470-like [Ipomoea nil]